jgi:hypothetical protein
MCHYQHLVLKRINAPGPRPPPRATIRKRLTRADGRARSARRWLAIGAQSRLHHMPPRRNFARKSSHSSNSLASQSEAAVILALPFCRRCYRSGWGVLRAHSPFALVTSLLSRTATTDSPPSLHSKSGRHQSVRAIGIHEVKTRRVAIPDAIWRRVLQRHKVYEEVRNQIVLPGPRHDYSPR